MRERVEKRVAELLEKDCSGHGMDHIYRVLQLSLKFAEKENANKEIVSLIALLHDVDDYKLFGIDHAKNLTNAKSIMNNCHIDQDIQNEVCSALDKIGYSKRLKCYCPATLEGQIVSDADMCDALGAHGILRTYAYSIKMSQPFFDKNIFPIQDITANTYINQTNESSGVCHMFEKILKLKNLMLTQSGKDEAKNRHQITVDFLHQFFIEENATEWIDDFNEFLDD